MPHPLRFGRLRELRPSEWCALVAGLVLLGCFQWDTWPVRFANTDDVDMYRVTQSGTLLRFIDWAAKSQGRFYQLWNLGLIDLFNHLASPFWFALHRTVLLGLEYALGAWLLARLAGARDCGWLFWIVGLGTLQIPPGYYLVLSYSSIAFGFVALLTAALAYDHGLTDSRPALLAGAAVSFFGSLLLHEVFAVFVIVFPMLWWFRRGGDFRGAARSLMPVALALGGYLAIYAVFRWGVRHMHSYGGTTPSFSGWAAARSWLVYTFSVAPGFELWIVRRAEELGPPSLRSLASAGEILAHGLTPGRIARTTLVATAAGWLLLSADFTGVARKFRMIAAGLALTALVACVPIALTAKYQAWAGTSQVPYAYGFYVAFFGWAAACIVMLAAARAGTGARPRIARILALSAIVGAAYCAQTTNPRVLQQLRETFPQPAPASATRPQP